MECLPEVIEIFLKPGLDAKMAATQNSENNSEKPPQKRQVKRFVTRDLTVRAAAVNATEAVEAMRAIQNSYPVPTVAVGRAMIASLLLASHLKNNQELSIYIQGSGPLTSVFAQASFEGKVRGVSSSPQLEFPIATNKILLAPAIGIGLLTVTHHLPGTNTPHRGTVELVTSEIGDDVAYYLQQSHQIPSAVSLGVQVNTFGVVEAAGGVLIELMPGHEEETAIKIEKRVKAAKPISESLLSGLTPEDILRGYLQDFELIQLDHDYDVEYRCRCSKERVKASISLLGLTELDEMIAKNETTSVSCEFCGQQYELSVPDLQDIRQEVYRQSLN